MSPVANATIQITRLLDARISELLKTKSFQQIARDARLRQATLRAMSEGRVHVPLNQVWSIATAFELDAIDLMGLALQQVYDDDLLDLILWAGARAHEVAIGEKQDSNEVTGPLEGALPDLISLARSARSAAEENNAAVGRLEARLSGLVIEGTVDNDADPSG
jgi:hypothetical protein